MGLPFQNSTKLKGQTRYHLLFATSMLFYHSLEYFTIGHPEVKNSASLLTLINSVNPILLQALSILVTFFTLTTFLLRSVIEKDQSYTIEISQKLIFPIQVCVLTSFIKSPTFSQQESLSPSLTGLFDCFLVSIALNFLVVILKNSKLSLRYTVPEKGFNKIQNYQTYLLLLKLITNLVFALQLPDEVLSFAMVISLINLVSNCMFFHWIIYENPKIQLLALFTQFFMWFPVLGLLINYSGIWSQNISVVFGLIGDFVYLTLCVLKPDDFVFLVEAKYTKCLKQLRIQMQRMQEPENLVKNLLSILSLYMDVFFDDSSPNLGWSDKFKNTLIYFLQMQAQTKSISHLSRLYSMVRRKIEPGVVSGSEKVSTEPACRFLCEPKTEVQISTKRAVSQQNLFELRPEETGALGRQLMEVFRSQEVNDPELAEKKQILYEVIWQMVHVYLSGKNSAYNRLRFFTCFTFPDNANYMKYRLFHMYYFNDFDSMGMCDRFHAGMTRNHLLKKIGHHNIIHKAYEFQLHQQLPRETLCLFKESTHYHMKFNNIIQETQIRESFTKELQTFLVNEKSYLQIFDNSQTNAQAIKPYYRQRHLTRKRIQHLLSQYRALKYRSIEFLLIANYIQDRFLNKNPHQAQLRFAAAYEQYSTFNKRSHLPQEHSTHKDLRKNFYHTVFNSNEPNKIQCVTSGLNSPGKVVVSSSTFKKFMEIQSELPNVDTLSIDKFILPLWRHKHQETLKLHQTLEKPFHHIDEAFFMLSYRRNHLLKIKFHMYFFMKFEQDLLLVLDFQQFEPLPSLLITDDEHNVVFEFNSSQKGQKPTVRNLQAEIRKVRPQKLQRQTITIFNTRYNIETASQSQFQLSRQNFADENGKQIEQKKGGSNLICPGVDQGKEQEKQKKFRKYKQELKMDSYSWYCLTALVVSSVIFVLVLLESWIETEKEQKSKLLRLIEEKHFLLTEFITTDQLAQIDLAMLNSMAKGPTQNGQTSYGNSFILQMSLLSEKTQHDSEQTNKNKYRELGLIGKESILGDLLFDDHIVENYEKSFITQHLFNNIKSTESLNLLVDINKLNSLRKQIHCPSNSPCNISTTPPNSSLLKSPLSQTSSKTIQQYLSNSLTTNHYLLSSHGFLSTLRSRYAALFISVPSSKQLLQTILQIGLTIFTVLIMYKMFQIKNRIQSNYKHAIGVSKKFLQHFEHQTINLYRFWVQLNANDEQTSVKQVLHKTLKSTHCMDHSFITTPSAKTLHHSNSSTHLTRSITDQKHGNHKTNTNPNSSSCLIEHSFALIPFMRYLVVMLVAFMLFYSSSTKTDQLQSYSKAIGDLFEFKLTFIQTMTLYISQTSMPQNGQLKTDFAQDYQLLVNQLKVFNKAETIQRLFPENITLANQLAFSPLQSLNLPHHSPNQGLSFFEQSSILTHNFQALFANLQDPNHHNTARIKKTYLELTRMLPFLRDIESLSKTMINQQMTYDYYNWLVFVVFFLVVELIAGYVHFTNVIRQFYQEYLNLADVSQLEKENGFSIFVAFSTQCTISAVANSTELND